MSATQELIAAALTAADELDAFNTIVHVGGAVAKQLREACARAMVQPAAPDIAEVERLVQKLESCAGWAGETQGENRRIWREEQDISRTALLDTVRAIAAERDALRSARLTFAPTEDQIQRHKIRAGDCPPDSEVLLVRSVRRFAEKAAPQPVGEVPMPEPVAWLAALDKDQRPHEVKESLHVILFRNYSDAECWVAARLDFGGWRYSLEPLSLVSDVRTYGEQCRATGVTAGGELNAAARSVLDERQRQISQEGWTPEHDDEHSTEEMAFAAACYCTADEGEVPPAIWPWDISFWKPTGRRRNLVKAGALILAEIERLDRADAAPKKPSWLCPNCPTPNTCQRIRGCDRDEIAR